MTSDVGVAVVGVGVVGTSKTGVLEVVAILELKLVS
jgi:hypothetical protein